MQTNWNLIWVIFFLMTTVLGRRVLPRKRPRIFQAFQMLSSTLLGRPESESLLSGQESPSPPWDPQQTAYCDGNSWRRSWHSIWDSLLEDPLRAHPEQLCWGCGSNTESGPYQAGQTPTSSTCLRQSPTSKPWSCLELSTGRKFPKENSTYFLHYFLFLNISVCPKCKQIWCDVAANGFLARKSSSISANFRRFFAK